MNIRYEILVSGHLTSEWSAVFGEMDVVCQPDGLTLICGSLPDQAALYGLITSLRDWGLTLVSVNPIALEENGQHEEPA